MHLIKNKTYKVTLKKKDSSLIFSKLLNIDIKLHMPMFCNIRIRMHYGEFTVCNDISIKNKIVSNKMQGNCT